MDPFEQMFRYGWLLDFGESPEQSLSRIAPAINQCDLSTSHFKMNARTMLDSFKTTIGEEAKKNDIDGSAIAAAIAWEYEQNLKGRLSDHFQVYTSWQNNGTDQDHGAGMGWGSMHGAEAKKLRPRSGDVSLMCQRMEAKPAIALVAEFMNNMAELYFETSNGIWVRNEPAILALFFNTGRGLVERSAANRANDPMRSTGVVTLDVGQNSMAKWVYEKASRFLAHKTHPKQPPNSIRAQASV
ncbi:MAG: hypothetical protein R3C59_17450 [Planctomycetaceae bacterium]